MLDISTQGGPIIESLAKQKPDVTTTLVNNAKIHSKSLRSEENIELLDDEELFDCVNDLRGLLVEQPRCITLSAVAYFKRYAANYDVRELLNRSVETQEKFDLSAYSLDMLEIGMNIPDIANEIFYFEDFNGRLKNLVGFGVCGKSVDEIHELDASIISSAKQLLIFLQ